MKVCIELTDHEAIALSGLLALVATINALPDTTVLCNRILKQVSDAMEEVKDGS